MAKKKNNKKTVEFKTSVQTEVHHLGISGSLAANFADQNTIRDDLMFAKSAFELLGKYQKPESNEVIARALLMSAVVAYKRSFVEGKAIKSQFRLTARDVNASKNSEYLRLHTDVTKLANRYTSAKLVHLTNTKVVLQFTSSPKSIIGMNFLRLPEAKLSKDDRLSFIALLDYLIVNLSKSIEDLRSKLIIESKKQSIDSLLEQIEE